MAMSAIGTVQQASAQRDAGKAQQNLNNYRAAVARNNAIRAENAAQDAQERGKEASFQKLLETKRLIGRQRAAIAGSGVLVDSGSAADIVADTRELGTFESLVIRADSEREAFSLRQRGEQFTEEASLEEGAGRNAASAGRSEAFGTLTTGLASVAQKWYGYKKEGIF